MKPLLMICAVILLSSCSAYRAHFPSTTPLYLADGEPGYIINCGSDSLPCIKRAGTVCGSRGYVEAGTGNLHLLPIINDDAVLIIKCKNPAAVAEH